MRPQGLSTAPGTADVLAVAACVTVGEVVGPDGDPVANVPGIELAAVAADGTGAAGLLPAPLVDETAIEPKVEPTVDPEVAVARDAFDVQPAAATMSATEAAAAVALAMKRMRINPSCDKRADDATARPTRGRPTAGRARNVSPRRDHHNVRK
jgi:hypothetical protein